MPKKEEKLNFEDSLALVEQLVSSLERGEMKLDDSITAFEKSSELLKFCQKSLSQAEKKIEILLQNEQGKPEWKELEE